ncbi:MAG: cysteine hydrolase [Bacilli bacterium]|nr:cysteine hydrolase [Bacilli bacterium]
MNKVKNLKVYKGMLIVVDMVNGFVREGVLHDEKIALVIPRQIELIKDAKSRGDLIVFIKDTHDENAVEFKRFGGTKHCVRGTSEANLVDELLPFENDEDTISIEKNSTSYMEAPEFRNLIAGLTNIERVDVVGCCTDICDFNGTMGLANYLDQNNRNVELNVHTDAVATYAQDARGAYVDAAYLLMEQQGIQLVKKR